MLTGSYPLFPSQDLRNAEMTARIGSFYKGMKTFSSKLTAIVFAFISLPLLYVLGAWFQYHRRKFLKRVKANKLSINTPDDYVFLKSKVEELYPFLQVLKEMSKYNTKKVPLLIRYPAVQFIRMSTTLVVYAEWLTHKIKQLDNYSHTEYTVFKLTGEQELWERRNKAYQYWV